MTTSTKTAAPKKPKPVAASSHKFQRQMESLLVPYMKTYGREACLSSIVRAWSQSQGHISAGNRRPVHIDAAAERPEAPGLTDEMLALSADFSRRHAQAGFEILAVQECSQSKDSVYTPDYMARHIIRQCIRNRLSPTIPTFLDPACGSGAFIIEAIDLISEHYETSKDIALNGFVWGIDSSPNSLQQTKINLEMFCLENKVPVPKNFKFLLQGDSLQVSKDTFQSFIPYHFQGFDIIATNPPYVKLHDMEAEYKALLKDRFPAFTQGSFSTALLFILKGHELLSPTGQLGYITQNNLLNSLAGKPVREFIQRMKSLNMIVNFGQAQVFRNARTYTCLLFLSKPHQDHFRFALCSRPAKNLANLKAQDFTEINLKFLTAEKWHLATERHLAALKKIAQLGTPLKSLADIRVGYATLKDHLFMVSQETIKARCIEPDILRPAVKVSEIDSPEALLAASSQIIQPYRKTGRQWTLIDESQMAENYPNAYQYLLERKEDLLGGENERKNIQTFYEWGRKQSMEAPGPKLLTKTFNKRPSFLLDESDRLFCNGYSVTPSMNSGLLHEPVSIGVMQKILESIVMDYYIRLTAFQIEGDYYCYQKNFIANFSIPRVNATTAAAIQRLQGEDLDEYLCKFYGLDYATARGFVDS